MTNHNRHSADIEAGGYQPIDQFAKLGYQPSNPQKRNIRGGYQPVADAKNQGEEKVLPPVPRGSSGESGRSGYRVSECRK
jgi:hypothetical protein